MAKLGVTGHPCQRKCQGCQIPVRKNRVRAGQGRPKPQQVEPADRNPDKKRGTPTARIRARNVSGTHELLTRFVARDIFVSRGARENGSCAELSTASQLSRETFVTVIANLVDVYERERRLMAPFERIPVAPQ